MEVIKTFTQYSTLTKYLQTCSLIIHKFLSEIPKCMIRNDFNHFMHIFSSWFKKKKTKHINIFYMRLLGLIDVATDFEGIKMLLILILTIAFSEANGFINSEPANCENSK